MSYLNGLHAFDPLDLEIIDRVHEVALAYLEGRNLYLDAISDGEQEDALRKRVFDIANSGPFDFDSLCDRVLADLPTRRAA
jgi:hypothetical protein